MSLVSLQKGPAAAQRERARFGHALAQLADPLEQQVEIAAVAVHVHPPGDCVEVLVEVVGDVRQADLGPLVTDQLGGAQAVGPVDQ